MQKYCAATLMFSFLTFSAFAADDVDSAVVASVKTIDRGAKTAVVKTKDGTEATIHYTAKGGKDAFEGVKEGDDVVVHYTEKGAVKTATEVDHVGKDRVKASEVAVKSVDHAAKTVTVKTADGAEETYHLTDRAVKETGKGLEKGGKVTVYYTEDAGKKIAHFFEEN